MKTKKTKLTKFYLIEKTYDRYDTGGISKATVKADKIENVILPDKFMYAENEDDGTNSLPVSKYDNFCDGGDFTKVNKTMGYLEQEESTVGIGTTPDKARAMLAKADNQDDNDEDWD
jgi:hypothetical protein